MQTNPQPQVVGRRLAEPVERKFLKALKNSDIEALTFPEQLVEGVNEGWITAEEKAQLEELRELIETDTFRGSGARLALALGKDLGNGLTASATLYSTDANRGVYFTPAGKFTGRTGLVLDPFKPGNVCAECMAQRIDSTNPPALWTARPIQEALC